MQNPAFLPFMYVLLISERLSKVIHTKVQVSSGICRAEASWKPLMSESSLYRKMLCPPTTKDQGDVKFAYVVPNFQNPTGLTYSEEKRKAVLDLVRKYHCILVEDDPYGELSFSGKVNGYISKDGLEESILLGETCFPKEVSFTRPDGGMFIWATLPDGQSAKELFDRAIQKKVAFVPGEPFYTDGRISNTMRLNYTNASKEMIEEGIRRIADSFADI